MTHTLPLGLTLRRLARTPLFTVVAVLPRSFRFLRFDPEILFPLQFNRAEVFVGNSAYRGVARLKPGVTIAQANADVARMIPMVIERFPLPPGFTLKMVDEVRLGPNVRPLSLDVVGDVGPVLWVLFGMVGIVLLIACANVANLFLVRAEGRQQELAIRAALGADRRRAVRELLGESVTLGLFGGVLGAGFAWAAVQVLKRAAPDGLPRVEDITIDPTVLVFTLGVSLAVGVLFGLVPALKFSTPHVAALKEGGRSVSDSRSRHRLRNALVIAEIALAMLLLVSAGLMIRTFLALRSVNPGYTNADEVLTLRLTIPGAMVPSAELTARMFEQLAESVSGVPGVTSVGLSSSITMDGNTDNDPIFFEDFPLPPGQMPKMHRYTWIGPGYAETMGNRLVAGWTLAWTDIHSRAAVAVVSENLARQHWKTPNAAVGRRIRSTPSDPWCDIVGVVGHERDDGVASPPPTIVYWPLFMKSIFGQTDWVQRSQAFAIRSTRVKTAGFMQDLQRAVWRVNRGLPLADVRTLTDIRARSMAQAAVSRLFLRHGVLLTGAGLLVGVGGAAALARLMATMLFGIGPTDVATYAGAALGLGSVALLATYLAARRAAKMDPVVAPRSDV